MHERDIENLDYGLESNPFWFDVISRAAKIQGDRRRKYSGQDLETEDPYTNFIIMAQVMGTGVQDVFPWYVTIKLARLLVGNEAGEDALLDSEVDLVNYAALSGGWRQRSPEDKLRAMLTRGPWIDVNTLEDFLGYSLDQLIEARKKAELAAKLEAEKRKAL